MTIFILRHGVELGVPWPPYDPNHKEGAHIAVDACGIVGPALARRRVDGVVEIAIDAPDGRYIGELKKV